MSTLPATPQVMMTLAALASTDATEKPYGKTIAQQEQQILDDINEQLKNTGLATDGQWQATWVGLTKDRANLAYIAQSSSQPPVYALCLRGTVAKSVIDILEDVDVGTMYPFTEGGTPPGGTVGKIALGAMGAFNAIVKDTVLVAALNGLQAQSPLCVTGHSLGGALATTVSLYLATGVTGFSQENIYPFTFAAPTAGDGNFASWFDTQFPWAQCFYNQYDVVPSAWSNLVGGGAQQPPTPEAAEYFYPNNSGVILGPLVRNLVQDIAKRTKGNVYVQPAQQPALNADFSTTDPQYPTLTSLKEWEAEAGYQHANNTYLSLLGAPVLPPLALVVESGS